MKRIETTIQRQKLSSKLSSMASTSSISNLLSFFTPSKPPHSSKYPSLHVPLPLFNPSSLTPNVQSLSLTSSNSRHSILPIVRDSNRNESFPSDELMSVVCPSLAYANTLYFRSAYNVQVVVDDNESEERLLNRFRREVMRAGVIQESKRRRFFENKQDEKKRKSRDAAKRNSRRRRMQFARSGPPQTKQEAPKTTKDNDDEDNWEMPEGGLPF